MTSLTQLRNTVFAIALITASGASAHITTTAGGTPADAPDAASPATSIKEQVLSDPESAKIAETPFYQNCAYCHGSQGSGGKARTLQCRELDADYLFHTISKGKRRGSLVMPPWEKTFDEKERWQLVAYIKSLADLPVCAK